MSYAKILQRLPEEWRLPVLEALEALKEELQEQFAIRREDVRAFIETQKRFEARLEAHDNRLTRLEQTVAGLVETTARLVEEQKEHNRRLERLEEITARLVQVQEEHNERLTRLEETVAQLVETTRQLVKVQEEHNRRLEGLEEAQREHNRRLERLEEAQREHNRRLEGLEEAQREHNRRLKRLEEVQNEHTAELKQIRDKLGSLEGIVLEDHYRRRAHSFFGRWLRNVRVVEWSKLEGQLRASLTPDEYGKVADLDAIIQGIWQDTGKEIWIALEVSATVDRTDVERAHERAALLRKAGWPAVPVAAGRATTQGALREAEGLKVVLLQNGRASGWQEALQAAGVL